MNNPPKPGQQPSKPTVAPPTSKPSTPPAQPGKPAQAPPATPGNRPKPKG